MGNRISRKDTFLLKEYDSAAQLTYHIDELRNKLTGFFLTFAGIASAALGILLRGQASGGIFALPELVVAIMLGLVSFVGIIITVILARLRRAQIEHFQIINNIRTNFLKDDFKLWNIVQLSQKTLPCPSRKSGSYFWLLLIIIVSSSLFTASIYLIFSKTFSMDPKWAYICSAIGFVMLVLVQDKIYFLLATPPPNIEYSDDFQPFVKGSIKF